jgi:Arc-like DNA binding dprotein
LLSEALTLDYRLALGSGRLGSGTWHLGLSLVLALKVNASIDNPLLHGIKSNVNIENDASSTCDARLFVLVPSSSRGQMARKPTDTAIFSLRIREELRKRIEREAQRQERSMNTEIIERLEESFRREDNDAGARRVAALAFADVMYEMTDHMQSLEQMRRALKDIEQRLQRATKKDEPK